MSHPDKVKKRYCHFELGTKYFQRTPQATLLSKTLKHLNELQKLNSKAFEIFSQKNNDSSQNFDGGLVYITV